MKFFLLSLSFGLLISGGLCAQNQSQDTFYLYLVGDAGEPTVVNETYRKTIQSLGKDSPTIPSAIVFLGDNIYPKGLESEGHPKRNEGEEILSSQLQLAASIRNIYFIPGNHDWKRGREGGLQQVLNQQLWIDSLKNEAIQFYPRDGCPGPIELKLSDNLVLVIIDSQWWLHGWEKPEGEISVCEIKTPPEMIAAIEDVLQRNEGKQVVIAGHHPIYTYGEHGGVSILKDHLFPLTKIQKNLYLPLPVVGSIYPLYRKAFGNIQDLSHPLYRQFRKSIHDLLRQYPGTLYVAGHEHALQYAIRDSVHYVVSGSGSKHTPVKKKGYAQFAESANGFVRLAIATENHIRIEYFIDDNPDPAYTVESAIKQPSSQKVPGINSEKTKIINASDQYKATKKKKKWFGENYRDVWSQEIEVPVFDFKSADGELKIIQQGGGQQTLSLRLEDPEGKQYALRSIEKYPEKAIPEAFRETFAKDIVQDQISASHPYGSLVIPPLADAAGIYHTNPSIVWVADDPRLGVYRKVFSNKLMLFEERPHGKAKGMDFFGNADDIVSTFKVIEKLAKDNDNQIDQSFVLRSRLFDLWIGDWDRHDDQWRWAEFDKMNGKLYRPIPRDRDQAFFVNEGKIPKLFSKRWALPKLQGFDFDLDWPAGFMFNARYFDRSFLTELDREDWMRTAEELKGLLTDEVIERSIRQWPAEIFALRGEEIIHKLKVRREKLADFALDHYLFLSRTVNIVGSDKHERFNVEFQEGGKVHVVVSKIKKDGEVDRKIYERSFLEEETEEVRLYGLDGNDEFIFSGTEKTKIKIRTIGGKGDDRLESLAKEKPVVYDKPKGIVPAAGSRFRDHRSSDPLINEYDRREFKYDLLAPLIFGNYNVDDGIFLGGGFLATRHGFRKDPYKTRHLFLGSYALNTSSFNFQYSGRYTNMIRKWSGELDLNAKSPNFVNNFFGLGNESVFDKNIDDNPAIDVDRAIDYYRLRFTEWTMDLRLSRKIGSSGFIKVGPSVQVVELERPDEDRFVKDFEVTLTQPILETYRNFVGVGYSWGFDNRNSHLFTTRGLYFEQSSRWMNEFNSSDVMVGNFGYHTATLAFYQSFRFPARLTFASRISGGITRGDFQLYQSQILDGKTELRGFRKTRFYGDSKLVFNNEVRFKLGEIRSYIMPASIGLVGFYDIGRVWYEDENGVDPTVSSGNSTLWHKGFGGGVWFTPYNMAVVSLEAGHSVEGTLGYLRLGFLF